jgi:ribosomal protein S18 acetylase RimI-like enzyme
VIDLLERVFVGEGHVGAARSREVNRRESIEPAGVVLTATEDGKLLGVVVLPHPGSAMVLMGREDEAEIRMLAVRPMALGRGIGEMLVRECLRLAAGPPWSASAVALWTQPQMMAARRLYERMGFVRAPDRDAHLPRSTGTPPDRLVRWAYLRPL